MWDMYNENKANKKTKTEHTFSTIILSTAYNFLHSNGNLTNVTGYTDFHLCFKILNFNLTQASSHLTTLSTSGHQGTAIQERNHSHESDDWK